MGVVIPFAKRAEVSAGAAAAFETVVFDAIRAGGDQASVMSAARPLLDRCRDRYGFVVMLDGWPRDPVIVGHGLVELFHGLTSLDIEMGAPRTYRSHMAGGPGSGPDAPDRNGRAPGSPSEPTDRSIEMVVLSLLRLRESMSPAPG